jgi:hypothetical protein
MDERMDEQERERGTRERRDEQERERRTRESERSVEMRRELGRSVRDVRESALDFWGGSCRLLSNLLCDLGEAIVPVRRRDRYEQESTRDRYREDERSRTTGDCIEGFVILCRSFSGIPERSDRSQPREGDVEASGRVRVYDNR